MTRMATEAHRTLVPQFDQRSVTFGTCEERGFAERLDAGKRNLVARRNGGFNFKFFWHDGTPLMHAKLYGLRHKPVDQGCNFVQPDNMIDLGVRECTPRHRRRLGFGGVLHHARSPAKFDGLQTRGSIVEVARQNDSNSPWAESQRGGTKEGIDGRTNAIFSRAA